MNWSQDMIDRVRLLRKDGKSICQISREAGVGTSTVFNWVKDMGISVPHTGGRNGGVRDAEVIKKRSEAWKKISADKRMEAYLIGKADAGNLLRDSDVRDFVCLYWAEGYKRSRNTVSVVNTDPDIIAICVRVMTRFAERPLSYRLFCTEEEKKAATDFWATRLGIAKSEFRFQRKKRISERRAEYGLVSVSAHETKFRSRLQAWMDAVKKDWERSSSG